MNRAELELSVFITSKNGQDPRALIMKIMEALHDGEREIVISPIADSSTSADPQITSSQLADKLKRVEDCSNARKAEILRLRETADEMAEELERLKGEREAPKWISVKDRLPEDRQKVLAFGYWPDSEAASIIQAKYYSEDSYNRPSFVSHALTLKHVSHWMKLPEPPKPQNNENL